MPPPQPQEAPQFISRQVTDAQLFYLNLNPAPKDFAIVCGGWEQCAEDYTIDRTSFPYYSIEFVASGTGNLVLAGERHALSPGVVFTYGPGVPHAIETSRTERLRKYFVDFTGSDAPEMLRCLGGAPGAVIKTGLTVPIRKAFDALIESAFVRDDLADRAARLQLEMLLLWIQRGSRQEGANHSRSVNAFDRCRQYITNRFLELRTVEQAAEACHIDVAYMTRLFRRYQNESPYQYLQRLRVQWAAERLQTLGFPVKAVADQLNMDPYQFSRMFKRHFGVPPSALSSSSRVQSASRAATVRETMLPASRLEEPVRRQPIGLC